MPLIIDSHAHFFPNWLKEAPKHLPPGAISDWITRGVEPLNSFREKARSILRPMNQLFHQNQPSTRFFPKPLRHVVDQAAGAAILPFLMIESTPEDLTEIADQEKLDYVMVISHPPYTSCEFLLEECKKNKKFVPVVNVAKKEKHPGRKLREYFRQGAKVLKIHAAADGTGPQTPRYQTLLESASELELPVIIHTGHIENRLFYKDPKQGDAKAFEKWFKNFPNTPFILAHMNFHEPEVAWKLASKYENIFMDTSWQPAESIVEAVRRVGAERVLFGTDWPLVGDNIRIGLDRVREAGKIGSLSHDQLALIYGQNAARLLKLNDAISTS